jgi:NAD(P)H-hydrate repair Nnr-like enzyme with NAD(P)H-hydrate dehydratase domain
MESELLKANNHIKKFPRLKEEINSLNSLKKLINKEKNSIFLIGPGAGVNLITKKRTALILKKSKYAIIDADALTCFKKNPEELYSLLDKNKIINPHIKEFHSIFPKISKKINNYEKIVKASRICKCNIVLKGANTLISAPNGNIILNKHTSSELAVIGSGDVCLFRIIFPIGALIKVLAPFNTILHLHILDALTIFS